MDAVYLADASADWFVICGGEGPVISPDIDVFNVAALSSARKRFTATGHLKKPRNITRGDIYIYHSVFLRIIGPLSVLISVFQAVDVV